MITNRNRTLRDEEKSLSLFENKIDDTELLTANELSKRLKINLNQIYKLVRSGKIPSIKIGRSVRFQWIVVMDSFKRE